MLLALVVKLAAQVPFTQPFDALKWRCIGPHRGGRTVGACGVPQIPGTFYMGVNNGGVWKTTDFGRVWTPVFDDQPTGSIGDVTVAPSNPNVVYVGSGEGLQRPDLSVGNGMYKSVDAGKTWQHLGLDSVQQIGGLAVDPTDENRVFVAALGRPYGANSQRGVYRSSNGGKTWEKVLYLDENTGAIQVSIDPNNPQVVYADMWAGRLAPWENGMWNGPNSGLFKSTDGGNTWKRLSTGLPDIGLGRIGFCIAPSDSKRLYACVDAAKDGGIYRSDDAGESWYLLSRDTRLWGRGSDFAELKTDPLNADIVYDANVVTWKSTDGGKTWEAFRGAPGGDDYHRIWIDPKNPKTMLIASDQGAIITVNGGETFSSWYNQPTAQFYHVSADNAFPYNVYSGQQESGSVGIASRGNDGAITFREWHPVGAQEYGYVCADPLNPNIIYGGKLSRYDKRTGQTENISPDISGKGKYRFIRTAPVLFSPVDHKTLYYAGNVIFKTKNGGQKWEIISPDLTRDTYDIPAGVGIYTDASLRTMPKRGVIYTIAPSPKDIHTIYCGTDDGLMHVTRNGGKNWNNITPPQIHSWDKISLMDAGHFDANTCYAAVNRIRCDDMRPHIFRTHDGGKTWTEIVNGLPNDPINVVREDPLCKGLLFAGSERAVYVSYDDGDHWQSLRLNMPATSIRDLIVKDDDIVVATHGRSFWILDNISPLRQEKAAATTGNAFLYQPQVAYRVRWNMNTDTPLPQEEPAGENPPDGAMIDYTLNGTAASIAIEIRDNQNNLVRKYSNSDTLYHIPNVNIPLYWIRPQQRLSGTNGPHRFLWDMHYQPLNESPNYPIAAIYKNTAPSANSPWVTPGIYTVTLIVDGHKYEQKLTVKMDPRVKLSAKEIASSHAISLQSYQHKINCLELGRKLMLRTDLDSANRVNLQYHIQKLTGLYSTIIDLLEACDRPATTEVKTAFTEAEQEWNALRKELDAQK